MLAWIQVIEVLNRLILALLLGLSVWSISIMIERRRFFRVRWTPGSFESLRQLVIARGPAPLGEAVAQSLAVHPGASMLQAMAKVAHPSIETLDRAAQGTLIEERAQMERGLTVLATLGSNAPYIGLFGTVLGIIQAFGELARQAGSSASVMSGISEALIATAVGLFVAIPALVTYNAFNRQIRVVSAECEILRDLWMAQLKL